MWCHLAMKDEKFTLTKSVTPEGKKMKKSGYNTLSRIITYIRIVVMLITPAIRTLKRWIWKIKRGKWKITNINENTIELWIIKSVDSPK